MTHKDKEPKRETGRQPGGDIFADGPPGEGGRVPAETHVGSADQPDASTVKQADVPAPSAPQGQTAPWPDDGYPASGAKPAPGQTINGQDTAGQACSADGTGNGTALPLGTQPPPAEEPPRSRPAGNGNPAVWPAGPCAAPQAGPAPGVSQAAGSPYIAGRQTGGQTASASPSPGGYAPPGSAAAGTPRQADGYYSNVYQPNGSQTGGQDAGGYKPNGYKPSGYQPNGYQPNGYQPGAWQLPPQVLAQAAAQSNGKRRGKPGSIWDKFAQGCKKLWKQLTSSLVVRIVCNGAVSAFAGFIGASIISAVLNLSGGTSFLFFAAFTLLIFIKMTNHTMSYVKDIAEAVGKISAGDYSVKVPEKYSDELGTLARQINQMTVELSRAREREQLEEQRKNEFITSIAHDLRTPLTSVIGYLGLISEQDGQPVEKETLVRYADVAFRKSKRLEQLISQLFDFSRYNFGEIHPAENRIDLAELLEQINQEFYPQFTERRLQSRVIISGRPVMVKGDGGMLVRVFDNILGNAVRYGAGGRYIDIELYNRGTEAVARVTNYGAEISPEDLARIFDKFYRTDASRSSETGGAGLGMAIAKNIVEAHGGRIRAVSGDGKVTFEVVLPVIAP